MIDTERIDWLVQRMELVQHMLDKTSDRVTSLERENQKQKEDYNQLLLLVSRTRGNA